MLSKKRRIDRKNFTYILNKGKRFNSPHLVLYLAPITIENQEQNSKFSFSISKKILKRAVDRNKYRRRGYSVVSKQIKTIKPGFFCFFSYKKGDYPISFSQIEKETSELLSRSAMVL